MEGPAWDVHDLDCVVKARYTCTRGSFLLHTKTMRQTMLIRTFVLVLAIFVFVGVAYAQDASSVLAKKGIDDPTGDGAITGGPARVSISPPAEIVGKVLGTVDTIPTMSSLSRTVIRVRSLRGTTTVTVRGADMSASDVFRINGIVLKKTLVNSTTARITILLAKLSYTTYTLRLYHNKVLVAGKHVTIAKRR